MSTLTKKAMARQHQVSTRTIDRWRAAKKHRMHRLLPYRSQAVHTITDSLSDAQRELMADNYSFSYQVARRTARKWGDDLARRFEDVVENGAVDALLLTAFHSTRPEFVHETAKGFLSAVVARKVRDYLLRHFGKRGLSRRPNSAFTMAAQDSVAARTTTVDEVIRHEQEKHGEPDIERARAIIGELEPIFKVDGTLNERAMLRRKARDLSLNATGSADELRARIAGCVRALLRPAPAYDAYEQFVCAWEISTSVEDTALTLGISVELTLEVADYLICAGVNLKAMP